jgi:hypothetical protein
MRLVKGPFCATCRLEVRYDESQRHPYSGNRIGEWVHLEATPYHMVRPQWQRLR